MSRNLAIETGCPNCVVSDAIEAVITDDGADGWVLGATLKPDEANDYRLVSTSRYSCLVPINGRIGLDTVALEACNEATIQGEKVTQI